MIIVSSLRLTGFLLTNPLSREYLECDWATCGGNNNTGSNFDGGVFCNCHCAGSFVSLGGIDFRISKSTGGGLESSGVTTSKNNKLIWSLLFEDYGGGGCTLLSE